ncbi:MAG: bacteriohemerythrin [Gammaproteobacteria bacterium]|nr:bacteriohemerythrin [Gammaproteobacteria bacterium]
MRRIEWTDDLNTNIDVIDKQHRRIVEYINQLYEAQEIIDKRLVNEVISDLVEYTVSHFSFEESLMEQANYPFLNPHKKVHGLFVKRVSGFVERHDAGEDITDELLIVLRRWLINHIKSEDQDYIDVVARNVTDVKMSDSKKKGGLAGMLKRFFG